MNRSEFCAHMENLISLLDDSYIGANLKVALNRYKNSEQKPPPQQFVRDPRNLCVHGTSLDSDCYPCAGSYGSARSIKGHYKNVPAQPHTPEPSR